MRVFLVFLHFQNPQPVVFALHHRQSFAFDFQQVVMSCMADLNLDALVYPTNNIPPQKIQAPEEPAVNGRNQAHWTILGQNGFPAITVPAGFTREVYDRVPDPASADGTGTRLVGPVTAHLPAGVDFAARPFGEPTLFRIASAFEKAATHREPPSEFTGLPAIRTTTGK
jgi:Asp-tRNA(Asn)/Glu-tRNA(Gln) amidotransferase A subunit family amidase